MAVGSQARGAAGSTTGLACSEPPEQAVPKPGYLHARPAVCRTPTKVGRSRSRRAPPGLAGGARAR